jgi:hypothetical protein
MEVTFMALQTEEGFILLQEVVSNGTMRIMTGGTALGNRGMLENERTLIA